MNAFEQNIYNAYLRISRSRQNKPFTLRKQFDNIPPEISNYVSKIGGILNRISAPIDDFFNASYEIYGNVHLPLEHFISMKAVKAYSIHLQKAKEEDIDSEKTKSFIIESVKFIAKFCINNSIKLHQYLEFKGDDNISQVPVFLEHLKRGNISWYILFAFDDFDKYIKKVPSNMLTFMFGKDFYITNDKMRSRYYHSTDIKKLSRVALRKIDSIIKDKIKNIKE